MPRTWVVAACLALGCGLLYGQVLRPVDAQAVAEQTRAAQASLRAEAQRLIAEEGAEAAVARLRKRAEADRSAAFRWLNLAVVVAVLAGQPDMACTILGDELPKVKPADRSELPLALGRHAICIELGDTRLRSASLEDLTIKQTVSPVAEVTVARHETIFAGLQAVAPNGLDAAQAVDALALYYRAVGDKAKARDAYLRSLQIKERLAPDSEEVAGTLERLALMCEDLGDTKEALKHYERALQIREHTAPDSLKVAFTLNALGLLLQELEDFTRALSCHRRALDIRQRQAPESLETAYSLNNIGNVYLAQGQPSEALEYYLKALELKHRLVPNTLEEASTLANVGAAYQELDDLDKALDYTMRSLAIREHEAPESLLVAKSLNNLGLIHISLGHLAQAQQALERALALKRKHVPRSLDVAATLANLGNLAQTRARYREALGYYGEALAIQMERVPDSLVVAGTLANMAAAARELGQLDLALEKAQQACDLQQRLSPGSLDMAGSLVSLATVRHEREEYDEALRLYQAAVAIYEEKAPGSLNLALAVGNLGALWADKGDYEQAAACKERALAIIERIAPNSDKMASALVGMGALWRKRGDLDRALDYLQRGLALVQRLAPDSLDEAACLHNLANVYSDKGDLDQALGLYQRALAICEREAPETNQVATELSSIGGVFQEKGDLQRALEYHLRALDIRQRVVPDSLDVAATLSNVALIEAERGNLDQALQHCQKALAIQQRIAPNSPSVAGTMVNLSLLYLDRGDSQRALEWAQRAEAIEERAVPGSVRLARTLHNLGNIYLDRLDAAKALDYYRRSLAIKRKTAPGSLTLASTLENIATTLGLLGERDTALEYQQEALRIKESRAPGSLTLAFAYHNLGSLQQKRGDLDAAEALYRRSLEIKTRLAPDSATTAKEHNALGSIAEQRGDLVAARDAYTVAVETLERARERSGAETETRSRFAAQYTFMYHDLIRVLVQLGESRAAADATERMRARGFLESLADRAVPVAEVPPALLRRQAALDARRNKLYNELRGLGEEVPDPQQMRRAAEELATLRLEQAALAREMRATHPRYAALEYPQPLSAAELAEALDPGTVVLSYVVDAENTYVFALRKGAEPLVATVKASAQELETKVEQCLAAIVPMSVRRATAETEQAGMCEDEAALAQASVPLVAPEQLLAELGALLLSPVATALGNAQRLLILPDGPLWLLPFHALLLEPDAYLCDRLPVCYAPSGTVFVEGRRLRQPGQRRGELLAMGDPDYGESTAAGRGSYIPIRAAAFPPSVALYMPASDAVRFGRLPYSGVEAAAIGELFGSSAQVRQGIMATETCVRHEGPGRRSIHLATHGLLDPTSPLDSAVVLTIPASPTAEDDGFLKAWEVFGLDLKGCDLVTLSACDTARGELLSGEGVVGLTRAFLYAGAASVLCTQWSVADESTAALMVRFYEHYRAGQSKDVALQSAMREIRTGRLADGSPLPLPTALSGWREEWSRPYHWAPFVLVGEYLQTTD